MEIFSTGESIYKGERYMRENNIEEKLTLLQEKYYEGTIAGNLVKG